MKLSYPNFELSTSDIGLFKIREGVKKNLEFSRFGLTPPPKMAKIWGINIITDEAHRRSRRLSPSES